MKKGFTVIELAVVMLIIFIVGVIASQCAGFGFDYSELATEYGHRMHLDVDAVNCMSFDTDGDGYVSCDLSYCIGRGPDGSCSMRDTKSIQCSAWQQGCKEYRVGW